MRPLLPVLAAGAAAWAVSVSGVQNNPPFALLLFVVAGLLVVVHQLEPKIRGAQGKARMWIVLVFGVAGSVVFGLGAYLLTNPPHQDSDETSVDTKARGDIGETITQIATLTEQFKNFQSALATEKAAKEDALTRLDDRAKRKQIRERLGQFLGRGRELQLQCGDESKPPPSKETEHWATETEAYLRKELGESYVARFRNDAGLPMTGNSIRSIPHRTLWAGIDSRLARLEQFIQEQA